ncbi:translation initiation factor [Leptolyngbya iicbica]|uniref:Translation initiation factor n=2 Tax=Cyanophyceae TaxID=3028117 RepID=A0A4Q7EFI9_9CYAN|nr:translation initiation factor [Leptolyngbya sp. LK]RZM81827.1 translation initiation factor [Leptolyngbya sp. LK]
MGKRKSSQAGGKGGDRTVYSEFATARTAATERAVPDLPPNQQKLKVEVSRKGRGGKTVTVISGFQHRPDTLKTLAKKLKAQCGTGGTAKDNVIEIQGDQADTVLAALQTAGYTAKRSGG